MTRRLLIRAMAIGAIAALWQVSSLKSEVGGLRTSDFAPQTSSKPRVVVLVVVDQMRADYFQRYADRFTDGFRRLTERGAVFTEARYPYASTKTAEAHALMLSGWSPSGTGIIGDRWYERRTGASVDAMESHNHALLGSAGEAGSPDHLLVHSVGDALKSAHPQAIVLTAAWKRYSAILMGGQHPDGAFWFDAATGKMVTSDYYMRDYPSWTGRFTRDDLTAPFAGMTWHGHTFGSKGAAPDEVYRLRFRYTQHPNAILLDFAKTILENSGVGADAQPDILAVSFAGVDFIGHEYGPETPEFEEVLLQQDRQLGDLFRALDVKFGADYTVVMTADHGAALVPEKQAARGVDAGRLLAASFRSAVEKVVAARLGLTAPVILSFDPPELNLNYAAAARQGIARQALDRVVVEAAQAQPGVARAYTVDDIAMAGGLTDPLLSAVAEGFYPDRSGDIHVLVKPNYIFWSGGGTTHGTPYDYDAHVPLILMGAGVRPGRYNDSVRVNELAPTVGRLLGVPFKGDPKGRVLSEALQH